MYTEKIKTAEIPGGALPIFKGFFKGVLIAVASTIIIFIIAALILAYTDVSESAIPVISFAVEMLGSVILGYCTAKESGVRGFLTGLASGLAYILLIWVIAALAGNGFYFNKHFFTMLALSSFGGAVGGVLGVNLKSKKSNKRKR